MVNVPAPVFVKLRLAPDSDILPTLTSTELPAAMLNVALSASTKLEKIELLPVRELMLPPAPLLSSVIASPATPSLPRMKLVPLVLLKFSGRPARPR